MKLRDASQKRATLDELRLAGLYLGSAWVMLAPSAALAGQVTSIPGGTAVAMPSRSPAAMNGQTFAIGSEVGVDIAVSSTSSNAQFGYTGGYSLCSNGAWTGSPPYAGTNSGSTAVSITFRFEDGDVESVGGFLNYAPSGCTGSANLVIEALDQNGAVIETYTPLISTPSAVNQGAFFGISRAQSDIAAFRISGGFAVLRNLTFAGYEAYDVTAPTLDIAGPTATQTAPFTLNFNFSENVVGFAQGDVSVSNATLSNFSGSGASYSATLTPTADGTVAVTVDAATYEDAAGNDNAGVSTYSVLADITAPSVVVSGPPGPVNSAFVANFAFSESVSNFTAAYVQVANGSVSNFAGGGAAYSATITPTTDGAVGISIPAAAAQDGAGNPSVANANAFALVADLTAPIVNAGPDLSVDTDPGQPTAVVTYSVNASDPNNGVLTPVLVTGLASGSAFPIGVTAVEYSATDAAGNSTTDSFTVTVSDGEDPVIVGAPANIVLPAELGLATAVATWSAPTVTDNAPGATITQTAGPASGAAFPLGVTTLSYQAQDASGRTVAASFTVTVQDTQAPLVVGAPSNIAVDTDAGQPTAVVSWSEPTVSDNAPGATIVRTSGPAPGSAFPIGVTTIAYEAQDGAGNTATASFIVTVADNELPLINGLPTNIAVNTDAGQATAVVSWTPPSVSDNDAAAITQTAGAAPGSAFPIGVTTITYVAEDDSGNQVSASFTVTVADAEPPAIVNLPLDMLANTDPGLATAVVTWSAPSVADNAPGASIAQTAGPASGSAFPIGATTITYTAQDAAGNTTTASFVVTVADAEAPAITNLPGNIAVNTDAGQPTALVTWTPPGVSDNTPGATIAQTAGPAPGAAFPVGVTTITYRAEDAAGNATTQSFTVAVTDAEPPVFVNFPNNIAITLDYPSTSAIANWTPPSASDNIPGATVTQIAGPAPGSTFALGATTISYRVQDANGNIVERSFTVTIAQTPPGQVRLVVESGADGVFAFNSPEPSFNVAITTVNGDGSVTIPIRPGVFSLNFVTPDGFGVMEASCDDPDSALDARAKTGTITVESNGTVTCTLVSVDSLNETSRMIGAFMGARAALIMQNMPDSDRRIDRLRGEDRAPGGVSAFGLNAGRGDLPFDLSFGRGNADFSFSLAGMRAHNRAERGSERAAWGQARHDEERTGETSELDFSGFGVVGGGAAPAPSSAQATHSGARALPEGEQSPVDVWAEGSYAEFETPLGDGDFSMLSFGADYVNGRAVLVGLSVQFDRTNMDGDQPGSGISGTGVLVGPYVTARMSEHLFFDGQAAIGQSSNQINPFGTYEDEVNADRVYMSGALIGDFEFGRWTVRPEGRVTYFREEMDAYVDSLDVPIPGIEVATGEFEFSPTVSYTYTLSDHSVVRPYASLDGIWTFSQKNGAAFAFGDDPVFDKGVRARFEGGFDFVHASGMQMSASGFYDGIGDADLTSWGARIRVSWSFEPE